MKNVFILLLTTTSLSASAQNKPTADSNTTLNGLPVLHSYVAPDVVERAKKKYGRQLYSLEKSSAANCQNSYLVGLLQNRRLTMAWMCDDAKMVLQRHKKTFVNTATP